LFLSTDQPLRESGHFEKQTNLQPKPSQKEKRSLRIDRIEGESASHSSSSSSSSSPPPSTTSKSGTSQRTYVHRQPNKARTRRTSRTQTPAQSLRRRHTLSLGVERKRMRTRAAVDARSDDKRDGYDPKRGARHALRAGRIVQTARASIVAVRADGRSKHKPHTSHLSSRRLRQRNLSSALQCRCYWLCRCL